MAQQPLTIGRYIIEGELGRGGWGIVYRAHDPELNRSIALKYISLTDEARRQRWRREVETVAKLNHPHIVSIYDAGQVSAAAYIVMELLKGGTLRRRFSTPPVWPAGVSLLLPLCNALAYAHQKGVIHRDVKPENILFSSTGEIKLVDFGLAYILDASRLTTANEMILGTLSYAAPEQIKGEPVDERADIFALGAVLYEILSGRPLFTGDSPHVIYQKIIQDGPVDLSLLRENVPPTLINALLNALAKEPANRYATANEFGNALRHCLSQGVIDPDQTLPPPITPHLSMGQPNLQSSIQLDWPTSVRHQAEEDELLRLLYEQKPADQNIRNLADRAISKVIIERELPGGFGGARILVVSPVEQNGISQAARVVKLGPRVMLETESSNYDNFVREHLPTAIASRNRFAVRGVLAALEYDFVDGGLLDPVQDLRTYYQTHSAHDIIKTLRTLLVDHLDEYWYRKGDWLQEHTAGEYELHLPAQVALTLRPQSDDWLGSENGSIPPATESYQPLDTARLLYDQEPASPGTQVQLHGFRVIRIKPWAATLAHNRENRLRVRVEYEPESGVAQQLSINQAVVVRGQVLTTRDRLLKTIVQKAFDESDEITLSADDDEVFAGFGRWGPYPNPIKLYPALLDEMLEGRRSIIHGDLHLRNILVDRDDRPWLIDFGRVRKGHTLFDFFKLETYIRLDVLNEMSGFTLAEYAQFEEALANTHYGLWAVKMPSNRELIKAFKVIRGIRRLAGRLYPQETLVETYFRCLLLYNLAVLKYGRQAVLWQEDDTKIRNQQLQAARLCFLAAAVQARWLKDPPPPNPEPTGVWEQLQETLSDWKARFITPGLYLSLVIVLVGVALGLGYVRYQAQIQANQERSRNLNGQGAIYLEQNNREKAADLFRQAIDADSRNAEAHLNLGMTYYVQGDFEQAIEQFQTAIELDPSDANPHFALGRLFDSQGQTEAALAELRQAIELDPELSEAYNEIGYILNQQKQYAEAVAILQQGLEQGQAQNPPYLYKNLGWAYLELAEVTRAIQHLKIAEAQLRPGDSLYSETLRLLARAYEENGDIDKALELWHGPLWNESDAQNNIERLSSMMNDDMK